MSNHQRGVTLLEIMIASAIAAVIVLGLAMVEGTRARVTEDVRHRVIDEPERKNAALAALTIAKDLERADRFNPPPGSGTTVLLNIRYPDCPLPVDATTCFENSANYQWVRYNLTGGQLSMYRFPRAPWPPVSCPTAQVLASGITTLNFTPINNGVTYVVTWTSGGRSQTFQGNVITRFSTETMMPLGLQNPSSPDVSSSPGIVCP